MKTINKDELFQHLGRFLKSKGIELKDGSYSHRIQQGCNLLADAVNATQNTVKRAKVVADKKLGQLRQTIHEATAPKPAGSSSASSVETGTPPGRNPTQSKRPSQPKRPAARAKAPRRK